MGIRPFGIIEVGDELGERVTTVKVLGIPLLGFFKGWCLAHLGFSKGKLLHRHLFGGKRTTVVGRLHITNDNIIRGAVTDDMMHVEEPIDVRCVTHHFGMKKSAAIELEGLYEFLLFGLNVLTE